MTAWARQPPSLSIATTLRKDKHLCLLFRLDANESNVVFDVRVNITADRDGLNGGYRATAGHAQLTSERTCTLLTDPTV